MKRNKRANFITLALVLLIAAAGLLALKPLRDAAEPAQTPRAAARAETAKALPEGASCTVEIRCDAVMDDSAGLAQSKRAYLPADGVILAAQPVTLEVGDTAFDVLRRVCEAESIALEFSFTPLYGSYYVEGIGNLYEFDGGEQSGWVYAVNGVQTGQASSSQPLSDGDAVVWHYSREGLGADVGG